MQDNTQIAPLDVPICSALNFEERQRRFEEAVGSMDRYGTPHDGIVNMLEALSDFIDDEAHGRKREYEASLKIMQKELDDLKSGYLPNADVDASADEKPQPKQTNV